MKKQTKRKKKTASFRMLVSMLLLLAGVLFIFWIINNTLLEKFYVYNKEKELVKAYDRIDQVFSDDYSLNDFELTVEKLLSRYGIEATVFTDQGVVVVTQSRDERELIEMYEEAQKTSIVSNDNVLDKTDNYLIYTEENTQVESENMILRGRLSGGEYLYMKASLGEIKDNVAIANRFFYICASVVLVVGIIAIIFVNRLNRLKIKNDELLRSLQEKEEIDSMRKEFLSNVTHELKTPLALIQGYAEGLRDGINEDQESREFYCNVIMDESSKMNKMVQRLLTLNQLEFGSNQLDIEEFNLTELTANVINNVMMLAVRDDIEVHFDQSADYMVKADVFKIEEVITNYLTNAINHCQGRKAIEITMTEIKGKVRTAVFNSGSPIPEEELERIWEKFYKVDKARTREYGGNGIGLSIVKAIMDSHGQSFGVSNKNDGVEFWFELELCLVN